MQNSLKPVSAGNIPDEVNVIIEIPANSSPVKYEIDKETGAMFVDRFISTPMFYPCNYGFVPETLADDGDPADALGRTGDAHEQPRIQPLRSRNGASGVPNCFWLGGACAAPGRPPQPGRAGGAAGPAGTAGAA